MFFQSDRGNSPESLKQQKKNSPLSGSDETSEDDFVSPSRTRNKPSAGKSLPKDVCRPSVSSVTPLTPLLRTTPDRRRSLDRTSWLTASSNLMDDLREKEREKWREFRDRKTSSRSAVLQLRLRKPKQTPTEPSEYNLMTPGPGVDVTIAPQYSFNTV